MATPTAKPARQRPLTPKQIETRRVAARDQIMQIMKDNGLVLTAKKVRVFFDENGKFKPGGELELNTLARMCNLPASTVLIAQVTLEPAPMAQNGQKK